MEVINTFIRDNQQRMVKFLDDLSVSYRLNLFCYFVALGVFLLI